MKTKKISRQKPAPKSPTVSSAKGSPAKKASPPAQRRSALLPAKTMPLSQQITARGKAVAKPSVPPSTKSKPQPSPAKTVSAKPVAKPRKRAPQHDSAYYAKLGERGGTSLMKQRGPEFFASIAKLSHPRAVYNGGRPKGSTKAKKLEQEAAAAKKLAQAKKQKK